MGFAISYFLREKLVSDVERCYRMLLSEQDTKGALFKAENILREVLDEAKTKTPNDRVERPHADLSREVRSDDGLAGTGD
jgi:hypothetical protein